MKTCWTSGTSRSGLLFALAVLATTALLAASPAEPGQGRGEWGEGRHPHFERMRGEHFERMAQFLDLTEQQKEEWQAIHEARAGSGNADREEIHALHERVRELASADGADPAEVGTLVIEIHSRMKAAEEARTALHEELANVLTPDQRERFEAMRELRGDRDGRRPFSRGHRMRGDRSRGWSGADEPAG